MRFINDVIFEDSNITASATGEIVDIRHLLGYSLTTEWTSTTSSATVFIQGSNDGETFVDIGAAIATINNNSGISLLNVTEEQYYGWIRVNIDYTSGTITSLKVTYGAKGI